MVPIWKFLRQMILKKTSNYGRHDSFWERNRRGKKNTRNTKTYDWTIPKNSLKYETFLSDYLKKRTFQSTRYLCRTVDTNWSNSTSCLHKKPPDFNQPVCPGWRHTFQFVKRKSRNATLLALSALFHYITLVANAISPNSSHFKPRYRELPFFKAVLAITLVDRAADVTGRAAKAPPPSGSLLSHRPIWLHGEGRPLSPVCLPFDHRPWKRLLK